MRLVAQVRCSSAPALVHIRFTSQPNVGVLAVGRSHSAEYGPEYGLPPLSTGVAGMVTCNAGLNLTAYFGEPQYKLSSCLLRYMVMHGKVGLFPIMHLSNFNQ